MCTVYNYACMWVCRYAVGGQVRVVIGMDSGRILCLVSCECNWLAWLFSGVPVRSTKFGRKLVLLYLYISMHVMLLFAV